MSWPDQRGIPASYVPPSKEEIEVAKTENSPSSHDPQTEPALRPDLRAVIQAMLKVAKRVEAVRQKNDEWWAAHIPGTKLAKELDALKGVATILERQTGPKTHILKCDPGPDAFEAVLEGRKTYEVRKNDRDYQVGDTLVLSEFDRRTGHYSGRRLTVYVSSMTPAGSYGLPPDLCVLGIRVDLTIDPLPR